MKTTRLLIALTLLVPALGACAAMDPDGADARDACALCDGGKADDLTEGSCDAQAVLALANTATEQVLDEDVGLDSRAAEGIVSARQTGDLTLQTLDAVPYVGPQAFDRMRQYATGHDFVPASCGETVTTHLQVPLVSEDDEVTPLSTYNDQIVAAGFEPLPDVVKVSDYHDWADLMDRIDTIAATVDMPLAKSYAQSPDDIADLCYRGDANEIADLAANLSDSVFGDMFLVLGYRYKDTTEFFIDDYELDGTERPAEWNDFDGSGENVMILHTIGDEGYEATAEVPRCAGDTQPPPPVLQGITDITCQTTTAEHDGTATIKFSVTHLGEDSMDYVWPEGDDASPFTVTPESSKAFTLVGGVADGYVQNAPDRLRVWADQDGFEFGTLALYKDSEYTRGYFLFEDGQSDYEFYTTVFCELTER